MPTGIYKRKIIIKKGDKFGELTAIKFIETKKKSGQFWLFRCDCKVEKIICVGKVKAGHTKSCGCLVEKRLKEGLNLKHGMYGTKIYMSWSNMKNRCLNKNHPKFKNYGYRGITICSEWTKFENFYKDIGERPVGKTLDRIDNNGNYNKENCKWSTNKEQSNNRRDNHLIAYEGKTQNMKQWSEELEIEYNTLIHRLLNSKWSIKRAFETKKTTFFLGRQ